MRVVSKRATGCLQMVFSLRAIIFVFSVLSVFALCFLVLAGSRLSFVVDASMKMKTGVAELISEMADLSGLRTINGSFLLSGTPYSNATRDNNSALGAHLSMVLGNGIQPGINRLGNSMNNLTAGQSGPRQDHCSGCFAHDFKYVITNNDICKPHSANQEIDLLILILTVHSNVEQRQAIRTTWLTLSRNNTANVRYAFLLGEIDNDQEREAVLHESKTFGDILKEDFVDKYANLTYKTIMGFKWAATVCPQAKFVMKTDDDMFVNVPNILKLVKDNGDILQTNVGGSCNQRAAPHRNMKSKWFASVRSYPNKFYPGFCSGTGFVTSMNVARRVYEISPHVPFFHLEDVYVSICIRELGYHLKAFPGFHPDRPTLDPCQYKGTVLKTAHYMTPSMLKSIWKGECHA